MWLPQKGKANQIQVDREKFMKHIVIDLEEINELISFDNNIIGNYSVDTFIKKFNAQPSPFFDNAVISQIRKFSQTDTSKCKNFVNKLVVNSLFWIIYFDFSKSEDSAGAGCILINLEGETIMLACRLEFDCTNNIAKCWQYDAMCCP